MKKFNLLLLVLVFSLLLGGCSGSGNSGGSDNSGGSVNSGGSFDFEDPGTPGDSDTPEDPGALGGQQACNIELILPDTYWSSTDNRFIELRAGLPYVITTNGYKGGRRVIDQHKTYGTTGSLNYISIPNLKGATKLFSTIQISDGSNRIGGGAKKGSNGRYYATNLTSVEFELAKQ